MKCSNARISFERRDFLFLFLL